MSNEYLKSLIDTVSGIEVKSEAEQIAKYELIESCIKYKEVLDKIKEYINDDTVFDGSAMCKNDLDKLLEEIE